MDVFLREKGAYAFERFRLDPVRRTLLRDGLPVKLGARLFDALHYLVLNHDRLVERDELQRAVWQDRAVDENSLGQAISALRKILRTDAADESFIVTVVGRGYRFGVPVEFQPAAPSDTLSSLFAQRQRQGMTSPGVAPTDKLKLSWLASAGTLVALLVLAMAVVMRTGQTSVLSQIAFDPPPKTLAVLAFTNLSGDPQQEYFTDGLSEELINSFSRISGLRVAARTSAFSFKGKPTSIDKIARALNVGVLLEGSARRSGTRVRISVQLVDTKSGFTVWSSVYDGDQRDIINIQTAVADAVCAALQVKLVGDERANLNLGGTDNPSALDAYLHARKLEIGINLASVKAALAALDNAISLDGNYAVAHARRAQNLRLLAGFIDSADPKQIDAIKHSALSEADIAVHQAPALGLAHAARGVVLMDMLDFKAANDEFSHALELAPRDADTVRESTGARFFLAPPARQMASLEAVDRGVALDPLSPFGYSDLAYAYFLSRRYDEALIALHHQEQLEPAITTWDTWMEGIIELMRGKPQAVQAVCSRGRDFIENECLALALHKLGRQDEATAQIAAAHAARGENDAYVFSEIFSQSGNRAEAIHWMQVAYRLHNADLARLRSDPLMDPVRDTNEYNEMVRKLDFPQ